MTERVASRRGGLRSLALLLGLCAVAVGVAADDDKESGDCLQWQRLLIGLGGEAERIQVGTVNRFVNGMRERSDRELREVEDYWASPDEFLSRGAGDCEDFVITKYISLRRLGIPDGRLRLAHSRIYNREHGRIEPHMVLLYRDTAGREWVLDNLNSEPVVRGQRTDLVVNYVFNTTGLWYSGRGDAADRPTDPAEHGKWLAFRQRVQSPG